MNETEFKIQFDELIKDSKSVLITSHQNPDEDSVASVLATYTYIKDFLKFNGTVKMAYHNGPINRWQFNRYFERIEFLDNLEAILNEVDTIILVDYPDFEFVFSDFDLQRLSNFKKIRIDHHNAGHFSKGLVRAEINWDLDYVNLVPSNSQNLYNIFFAGAQIDGQLAETLLFGILGDTKVLRTVDSNSSSTLTVVKDLLDAHKSISLETVYLKYENYTPEQLRYMGKLLQYLKVITIGNWPPLAYIAVDEKQLGDFGNIDKQRAGFLLNDIIKLTAGSNWSMFIRKKLSDETINLSIRSTLGSVDASKIVNDLKIGGGHKFSVGGKFGDDVKTIDEAVKIIFDYLENNEPVMVD